MNSLDLRNYCQKNLEIGEDSSKEKIWLKQLRRILETDIHENELGCWCKTHIKIGTVHLASFYETRILFSHSVWINRFSDWICEKICEIEKVKKIVVIGYETEIETVLFSLQTKVEKMGKELRYAIFEEKKYTQNNGYRQTEENIRYLDNIEEFPTKTGTLLLFLSGTSSTLSTFFKMKQFLHDEIKRRKDDAKEENVTCAEKKSKLDVWASLIENAKFYSIIQVLPNIEEKPNQTVYSNESIIEFIGNKCVERNINGTIIKADYLIHVMCDWYDAEKCKICYPEKAIDEKPIISTSETSFVPFQMIKQKGVGGGRNSDRLLFENGIEKLIGNEKDGFKYTYYDHIDRLDQHFKYYIRTAHLLKDIIDEKKDKSKRFIEHCEKIKNRLKADNCIDIIVFPSNFGDEVFPLAINEYVFNRRAYILSLNPNKEFRSNFRVKYSNIAYFLEQLEGKKTCKTIRFHYVAKQLLSEESYTRIKSLVRSLMDKYSREHGEKKKLPVNVDLFNSVITFLSRISDDTIRDYIDDISRYFSFIDVSIPMLRNYGDSCPICKRRQEVAKYVKASSLDICAAHWAEKFALYKPKSIEEAINTWNPEDSKTKKKMVRKYRRFLCENKIWEELKRLDCNTEKEYLEALKSAMETSATTIWAELKGAVSNIDQEYINILLQAMENNPTAIWAELKKAVDNNSQAYFNILMQAMETKNETIGEKPEWTKLKKSFCGDDKDYFQELIKAMKKNVKKRGNESSDDKFIQAEYYISYVKAISGPFLYYKEYEKDAALHLILSVVEELSTINETIGAKRVIKVTILNTKFSILFNSFYEQYTALVVMINCLADMDSAYLLSPERIVKLCNYVETISDNKDVNVSWKDSNKRASLASFGKGSCLIMNEKGLESPEEVSSFYSCIVYAFKRIICGISGDAKIKKFNCSYEKTNGKESEIEVLIKNIDVDNEKYKKIKKLFDVLYIENSSGNYDINLVKKTDIMSKYGKDAKELLEAEIKNKDDVKIYFVYYDSDFTDGYYPIFSPNGNEEEEKKQHRIFLENFNSYYLRLIKPDDNESDTDTVSELERCGFTSDDYNSVFVISLEYHSVENDVEFLDENRKSRMYLIAHFIGETKLDNIERMKCIREMMKFKYSLSKNIAEDIANNSIKEAIQAREAEKQMTYVTTATHNGNVDVIILMKHLASEIEEWINKKDNNTFSDILKFISHLMSFCIGTASNEYLLLHFYNSFSKELLIAKSIVNNGYFHIENGDMTEESRKIKPRGELDFIKQYFDSIRERTIDGYECGNVTFKYGTIERAKVIVDMTDIVEGIREVDALPCCIGMNNGDDGINYGSVFLIGILDLFFKDISKHSKGKDVEILFSVDSRVKGEKMVKCYSFTIQNDIGENDSRSKGITERFFSILNSRAEGKKQGYFDIERGRVGSKYRAKLTVYGTDCKFFYS